ncbi:MULTISPECIES: undecaprenyl-diphosphate phosphatase [unclassified Rhodococcus (in: high G+C Gram-positive bacteria)]|uniref:undecaprenyl-diphosphate phosphatase n=1 Tax=unclassified Rhodococcus (in: high G+C Gram-positive bacteria) TaxID=192944 RepID=UPI00163B58B3|nr:MULTISPECIES: undecaprenyl-diphosphate phosphatase [unclassified Rhodococcus (in: high G+C Gram-positive bacteria)]MBC2638235.1 undecaprenyl-diphosphate phosphatase [Rhodococcus sp. 3A]MBC2897022.1 undecaprenyl-diphosphate phosphatase [Rhodococcus sp. 4CII]
MSALTYPQSIVLGALQGVTELFPISSLGHSVLLPAWLGGSWEALVTEGDSDSGTPFLAFIVALHVATAVALLIFYARDWVAIIGAFVTTVRTRRIETSTERLAWLIIVATIPVGVLGLVLEHPLRTLFATPLAAAVFLTINGVVLAAGEVLRRRAATAVEPATLGGQALPDRPRERPLDALNYPEAAGIGVIQSLALLAGISRSGVTIVGGLLRGLSHEDAAKFAFLLATPVILAAGVLKLPTLAGPQGAGIHGQILVGALVAGVAAFLSVKFLTRYFATKTLIPFAVYCLVVGVLSIIRFA